MGQYHSVYNVTKKQVIRPHGIHNGAKAYEQVGHISSTATAIFALLMNSNNRGGGDIPDHHLVGSWAGDRIVIQGDYAESGDTGFIPNPEEYTDISHSVRAMLCLIAKDY